MTLPPLHPFLRDRIESERCPDCGGPGRRIAPFIPQLLDEWGCPDCEPALFDNHESRPQ